MSRQKLNEAGQSTIEFILTFAFAVSMILLIFNSAMNYTTGYLVHYATFMASRTYLTADNFAGRFDDVDSSLNGAEERARQTFARYRLNIFKIPDGNFRINHASSSSSASDYLTVGAYTIFEQNIDILGRVAGQSKLELVSESFLGKEPTRAYCARRVCEAITGGTACSDSLDVTLFDDGC